MKIEVLVSQWSAEGQTFAGGVHEIEKPTKKLLGLVGAAPDTTLTVLSASKDERAALKAAVESQAKSEKRYAQAQRDGSWHAGNYDQYLLDVENGSREPDPSMPDRETYIAERTVS